MTTKGETKTRIATIEPIFIFAGQSNMAGRCLARDLPIALSTCRHHNVDFDLCFDIDMNFGDPNARGHSNKRFENLGCQRRGGKKRVFGPEMSCAQALAVSLRQKYGEGVDIKCHFIKFALGSTSLAFNWDKSNSNTTMGADRSSNRNVSFYPTFVAFVKNALSQLPPTAYLQGIFWHQGSNDSSFVDQACNYEKNFRSFVENIRADFSAPGLPVVCTPIHFAQTDREMDRLVSTEFQEVVNEALVNSAKNLVHVQTIASLKQTATIPEEDWLVHTKTENKVLGRKHEKWPSPGHLTARAILDIGCRMGKTADLEFQGVSIEDMLAMNEETELHSEQSRLEALKAGLEAELDNLSKNTTMNKSTRKNKRRNLKKKIDKVELALKQMRGGSGSSSRKQ
jgi:hypothetical protein